MASRSRTSQSRCGVVGEGFNDLLCRPGCGRMLGDREMDDAATFVCEEHQHEQYATRQGRDREEVHRYQRGHVIHEKGSPRVRWPAPAIWVGADVRALPRNIAGRGEQ